MYFLMGRARTSELVALSLVINLVTKNVGGESALSCMETASGLISEEI